MAQYSFMPSRNESNTPSDPKLSEQIAWKISSSLSPCIHFRISFISLRLFVFKSAFSSNRARFLKLSQWESDAVRKSSISSLNSYQAIKVSELHIPIGLE